MYMSVSFACMSVYAWLGEGVRFPGTGCLESNQGPLEEQSVTLTTVPSLHPLESFLCVCVTSRQGLTL